MVRDYDSPDPARVVANLRRVLEKGDMTLLEKGAYVFLITHCGFIAHYNHAGFIAEYRDDLPGFAESFLSQLGLGWDTWISNPKSYLYDTSYRGKLLADIIRELVPIFSAYLPGLQAAHAMRKQMEAESLMRRLADQLGYEVVRRSAP